MTGDELNSTSKSGKKILLLHYILFTSEVEAKITLMVENRLAVVIYHSFTYYSKEKEHKGIHDSIIRTMKSIEKQNFHKMRNQIMKNRHLTQGLYRANALAGMQHDLHCSM